MSDIIERLTEYNKDWRTRAGSAQEVAEAISEIKTLRNAAIDALAGWKYIREHHGDLYGVGWERVQTGLEAALSLSSQERQT